MIYGILTPDAMPHPAALIDYGEGGIMAAMFHYASEGCSTTEIAAENGYDIQFLELPEDDPLWKEHEEGNGVVNKWRPDPPEGWVLGGVVDSEDGPVAIFLKALEAQNDEQEAVA